MPTLPPPRPEVIEVDLATLIVCSTIQPRHQLTAATVAEYAALYQDGHDLGPITVFQEGETRYVVDGFHRTEAAWQVGKTTLPAVVHQGSLREARLFAMGCNKHGQPYSNADKRRNVAAILADPEWRTWSDRRIARHCGCTHPFVRKVRAEVETVTTPGPVAPPLADGDQPPPLAWPEDPQQVRPWVAAHLQWLGDFEGIEFAGHFRATLTQGLTAQETCTLLATVVQQGLLAVPPWGQYTYIPTVGETMPALARVAPRAAPVSCARWGRRRARSPAPRLNCAAIGQTSLNTPPVAHPPGPRQACHGPGTAPGLH